MFDVVGGRKPLMAFADVDLVHVVKNRLCREVSA